MLSFFSVFLTPLPSNVFFILPFSCVCRPARYTVCNFIIKIIIIILLLLFCRSALSVGVRPQRRDDPAPAAVYFRSRGQPNRKHFTGHRRPASPLSRRRDRLIQIVAAGVDGSVEGARPPSDGPRSPAVAHRGGARRPEGHGTAECDRRPGRTGPVWNARPRPHVVDAVVPLPVWTWRPPAACSRSLLRSTFGRCRPASASVRLRGGPRVSVPRSGRADFRRDRGSSGGGGRTASQPGCVDAERRWAASRSSVALPGVFSRRCGAGAVGRRCSQPRRIVAVKSPVAASPSRGVLLFAVCAVPGPVSQRPIHPR